MKTLVIYKSKYGSTRQYASWIGEELGCEVRDVKKVKIEDLDEYDIIIYGGGLYAEVISGVNFITKNLDRLSEKKIIVFSTGITPLNYREYYDKLVLEKNFKPHMLEKIKVFNFLGKMILDELSLPHKTAIKALKKLMSSKENPTEMEKLLIDLCDADGDFTDKKAIVKLINYAKNNS
ncbi:MAG: flavodoxin [Ruminococcaceae bacterium]|nr:flavodoxin [Oscillospiraceae bacterium]